MRRTAALLLVPTIALSACSSGSGKAEAESSAVPTPVATLPIDVAQLSQTVGEYVVDPRKDLSAAAVEASLKVLRSMPGVQSAELVDAHVRVEILPAAKTSEREAVERQLAALGTVSEGI